MKKKEGLGEAGGGAEQEDGPEEAEQPDQEAHRETRKPRVEVSWIEEEAKLWIQAVSILPRSRFGADSNSRGGSLLVSLSSFSSPSARR